MLKWEIYIKIIRKDIDLNTPLTAAQVEMLKALADRSVTPDEECPELTPVQIAQFKQRRSQSRGSLQADRYAPALHESGKGHSR